MSSSVGNNIPLTAPPEEQFGRTMRIPDEMLEQWWALVAEQPVPRRRADGGEARARALHRRRSHGEDAARAAEAHFTRVVREGGAPERRPRASRCPPDDPVHLPARDRGGVRAVDERGTPDDRPGRREARRRAGRGARPAPLGRARQGPPGRQAALRDGSPIPQLDSDPGVCYTPSAAREGGNGKPCDAGAPSLDSDTTFSYPVDLEASGASGGLFVARPPRHRSLKTQQRACATRSDVVPIPSGLPAGGGLTSLPVNLVSTFPVGRGTDAFERRPSRTSLELEGRQQVRPASPGNVFLHGEFDPGSGRTLAARLTHASRARTRASALGTAANG